jgi:hypothetical protein
MAWKIKRIDERDMQTMTFSRRLSQSSKGRAVLHLLCLMLDGHVRWHIAGIKRELSP